MKERAPSGTTRRPEPFDAPTDGVPDDVESAFAIGAQQPEASADGVFLEGTDGQVFLEQAKEVAHVQMETGRVVGNRTEHRFKHLLVGAVQAVDRNDRQQVFEKLQQIVAPVEKGRLQEFPDLLVLLYGKLQQ